MTQPKLPYPIIRKILSEIDIGTFLKSPEIYYYMTRNTKTKVEWKYFVKRVLNILYAADTIEESVLKLLTFKNPRGIPCRAIQDCQQYISTLIKEMRCQRILKKTSKLKIRIFLGSEYITIHSRQKQRIFGYEINDFDFVSRHESPKSKKKKLLKLARHPDNQHDPELDNIMPGSVWQD